MPGAEGSPIRRRLHVSPALGRSSARMATCAWRGGTASSWRSRCTTKRVQPRSRRSRSIRIIRDDEEPRIEFTERIVLGMGGDPASARQIAHEVERAWKTPTTSTSTRTWSRSSPSCVSTVSGSGSSRTARATCASSYGTTRSTWTSPSPPATTGRSSPIRRSSARRSISWGWRTPRPRWSATTSRTTSGARRRSGCGRFWSTARTAIRRSRSGSATSYGLPAALGLVRA